MSWIPLLVEFKLVEWIPPLVEFEPGTLWSEVCNAKHTATCINIQSTVSHNSVRGQLRPWSDCTQVQSDQGLHCPHTCMPWMHSSTWHHSCNLLHWKKKCIVFLFFFIIFVFFYWFAYELEVNDQHSPYFRNLSWSQILLFCKWSRYSGKNRNCERGRRIIWRLYILIIIIIIKH